MKEMSRNNKLAIYCILFIGLLITPSFLVFAETASPEITDLFFAGTSLPEITNYLAGIAEHPNDSNFALGDYLLRRGDNTANIVPGERQAYLTARSAYLAARQQAITNGRYQPDTNSGSAGFYVTGVQSRLTEQQHIDDNNSLIEGINLQLQDPTLTEEERQTLEEYRQSLVEDNINRQRAIDGSLTNQKGIIQDAQRKAAQESAACFTWTGGINIGNCILQGFAWLGTIITGIFGVLLWLAGMLLDLSISMSIYHIRDWLINDTVSNLWKVSRDIANIFFIFILLYIAIATIFDLSTVAGNVQKLVVSVIIAALLVNFSGFLTRVVVDATNIVAVEFYNQMSGGTGIATGAGATNKINNIGWKFVQKLDLTQYYVEPGAQNPNQITITRLSFTSIIAQTLGNIILILCTAFLFLVAAGLFLIRTLSIVFLYIISPLVVASRAMPVGKFNYFKKWWETLLNQALVAPGFLIPLYLVFYLLGSGITARIGTSTGSLVYGGGAWTVLVDVIMLGLLVLCLKIARELGAYGVDAIASLSGKATLGGARMATSTIKRTPRAFANAARSVDNRMGGYGARLANRVATSSTITRTITGARNTARSAWNSKLAQKARNSEIGQFAKERVKGLAEDIKWSSIYKDPLLAINDKIAQGASYLDSAMGGKQKAKFEIFGSSTESRKAAKEDEKKRKEDEKKRKEDEKKKKINDNLKTTLASLSPQDKMTAKKIIDSVDEKDTFKLIDPKIFVDFPFAAQALNVKQLKWILQIEGAPLADIKAKILTDTNTGTDPHEAYDFMSSGPGTWMYS